MSEKVATCRTERGGRAVRDHEARVEAAVVREEGGQLAVGGVDEALDAPLAHARHLVHADRQVVARLPHNTILATLQRRLQ